MVVNAHSAVDVLSAARFAGLRVPAGLWVGFASCRVLLDRCARFGVFSLVLER